MRAEDVNSESILEAIREYERWLRMFQVNARKIKDAVGTERAILAEQAQVIRNHLAYYESLLTEMKQVYSPVTVRELFNA